MRSRRRVILMAFLAALLAALFALPIIKGEQCRKAGGTWDRTTFSCQH